RAARTSVARTGGERTRRRVRPGRARAQGDRPVTHPVHRPGHVGARFPKVDGAVKADGSGIYADDIHLPRMLHAKILRSPHANARIRSIDLSEVEKYPGVVATLVGAEMPAKYGVIPWTHDEQALATDHVRFVGDEVACIAALGERTAGEGLGLIGVECVRLRRLR